MTAQQSSPAEQVNVHHLDLGGCIRFFTDAEVIALPNLPLYLAYAVTAWFRSRPQCCLTSVLPVNKNGNTVEIYAWYTQHALPAPSNSPLQ